MSLASASTLAARVKRVSISIPAAAGTAATILSLLGTSLDAADLAQILGGQVAPAASDYVAGDSVSSLPLTVTAGDQYTEPAINFLSGTYVKAASGAAVPAVVSVWLSGTGRLGL